MLPEEFIIKKEKMFHKKYLIYRHQVDRLCKIYNKFRATKYHNRFWKLFHKKLDSRSSYYHITNTLRRVLELDIIKT